MSLFSLFFAPLYTEHPPIHMVTSSESRSISYSWSNGLRQEEQPAVKGY